MSLDREARILVVDDQREVARVLRTALELSNRGYYVIDVPSGEEALLELGRGFDVIVTDYRLPGMNGAELIKRIAKSEPEVKAILITGYPLDEVKSELKDVEVYKIFEKPIDTGMFVEAVTVAIHGEAALEEQIVPTVLADAIPEFNEAAVARSLEKLHGELGSRGIAFVSRVGKVLHREGAVDDLPRFDELAVLLANNYSTMAGISTHIGDRTAAAIHYYEGNWYDIYTLSVGAKFFVTIVFPGGSQKQMGPVLRYGKPAVLKLQELIVEAPPEEEPPKIEEALEGVEEIEETAVAEEPDILTFGMEGERAVEELDLDLDSLESDLEKDLGNLDAFWEEAGAIETRVSDDALSLDEAVELGLIPEDKEID
jgi:CheY-like chemotaxis protein